MNGTEISCIKQTNQFGLRMGRDCCIRGKLLGLRLVTGVQPETGEAGLICGRENIQECDADAPW